ncbi:DUF6311 domain-containing protein [Pseudomonas sp. McL0111]|uniref:DUF6311 domain-containing protein n=1 Tax=Pseudomonas sp. McL0111 TaxID=3457357 RepID=UPI00403EA630
MKDWVKRLPVNLLPAMLGILAFFIVIGPRALNPQNIAWLGHSDPATHYLGWAFFRNAPWSFPLGLNPSYGLELSNAIIFSDSNPLFAFVFKPFTSLLPEPFQYFGLWLLMCFVLQSWFAWKLMGLATVNVPVRLLGSVLFLFNPAMIVRMGVHLSLAGHFLILAALYLALRPENGKRSTAWGLLLAVAALVHAYLLAMIALIWIADLLHRTTHYQFTVRKALIELFCLLLLTAACCWQAGYFVLQGPGLASIGFGLFRANALTFFTSAGWSYVLPALPGVAGDGDGMAFPGLGVMFLLVCALPLLVSSKTSIFNAMLNRWVLILALVGLMVFAFSNKVGIGAFEFDYALPDAVVAMASVFRASGRMIWPVMYAAIFAVVFLIAREHRPHTAIMLLASAMVLQIADTRAGWANTRSQLMASPGKEWTTPLVDPFWRDAALHYQKVRWVVPQNFSTHWMTLSDYASKYNLATDAVYLGRVSAVAQEAMQRTANRIVESGKYDADTLYVLDQRSALQASVSFNRDTDALTRIDGFYVLAPGWKRCADCPAINPAHPDELISTFQPGERIAFSDTGSGTALLAGGWWISDVWGTGSVGSDAEIILKPAGVVTSLSIEATAFLAKSHPRQAVEIRINQMPVLSTGLTRSTANKIDIALPVDVQQRVAQQGMLRIQFHFPSAVSPHDLGMSVDERKLAIGLLALTFH